MIPIVTYTSARDVIPVPAVLESWEHLGAMLAPTPSACAPCEDPKACPGKMGLAWSPAKVNGFRADANVRELYALVLDFDKANAAVLERIRSETAGLKRIIHSTHSHRPPDAGAYRVVLALSRPVPADEWTAFYLAAIDLLDLPADKTCANPSRLYFLPTHPEGLPFVHEIADGEVVDVDAILETIPPAQRKKKYRAASSGDTPAPEIPAPPVDLADLTKGLAQLAKKYEKAEDARALVVRAILDGTPLAVQGERDSRVHQAASICATRFPAGTSPDAMVVVMRPSIEAMPTDPEGVEFWLDKARFSYRRAMERRIESDAKVAEVNKTISRSLHAIVRDRAKGHGAPETPDPDDAPEAEGVAPGVGDLDDEPEDDWFKDLKFKPITKEGDTPRLVACEHNATVILSKSPAWRNVVRFNEVTKRVEVGAGAPVAESDRHPGVLPRAVANWLQQEYDLFLGEGNVASILLLVARRNPYDPIREYLDAIRWDGKARLDGWLITHCQAIVGDDAEDLEHVQRTGRRFLIGAAARALRPGCQMDTVLVLEGEEGVRKTTLFRVLGGAFYSSSMIDLSDKDTKLLAAQTWIVELAELTSLRKSDDESAKAFLTTTEDRFRPPYGAAIEVFPRRAVFVGTTNAVEDGGGYLKGRTGNRRWWPVRVGEIDIPAIRQVRDQLWAEAVVHAKKALAALDAGADPSQIPDEDRWWHVGGEEVKARRVAMARVERTLAHDLFEHWWFALEPGKRPRYQSMPEALVNVYKKPLGDLQMRHRIDLGYTLADYGFHKKTIRVATKNMRVYEAPELLLNAPRQVKGASGLVVVDGGEPRKAGPEE